jgi:hypothetical protein
LKALKTKSVTVTYIYEIHKLYIYVLSSTIQYNTVISILMQGRIQDFKLGGAHLKKSLRAEGGAKIFGVFRVKNHDLTTKNHIFSNCRGRRENFWVFRVKNHDFTPKNHFFSNFRGGARAGCAPLWIRLCNVIMCRVDVYYHIIEKMT